MSDLKEYSAEFMKFLSQLAAATGDLSSMTCPAFLLNGYSLLEYSQHWADHPSILWACAAPSLSPEERMERVVAWFLSTLHGSFRSRCETSSERKPFNPVLGETFRAAWKEEDGENAGWGNSSLVVEQVSHHPPVSAFCVQIPSTPVAGKPRITVQGHCGQRTTFNTTSIIVKQVGRVIITISGLPGQTEDLEYIVYPLPELAVAGLLTMSIYVELAGKTKITCVKGGNSCVGEVEYIPVGWFTGEHFALKGTVKSSATTSTPYCTISGKWTTEAQSSITATPTSTKTLFSVQENRPSQRYVPTLDKQGPNESLNLWGPVVEQLRKGDYAKASELKTVIEEAQRALRKQRVADGKAFTPVYFEFVPGSGDGVTKRDPQGHAAHHDHSAEAVEGEEEVDVEKKEEELGHWIFKKNSTITF